MRVALVVMPFAAADRPSLAAGLLQAALKQRGIACDTKHFNVTLARLMGHADYRHFVNETSVSVLSAEWAFSQAMFGEALSTWETYEREVLDARHWGAPKHARDKVLALRALAPMLLQVALESNDWSAYDLVGFTSSFEQVMPSLALARLIKQRHPRVKIAVGGASFESGMGRPYIEHFDFLDYVSNGEADLSFPELCARLRDGDPEVPAGFFYRSEGAIVESPRAGITTVEDLDRLPTPDYGDFFRVARATFGDGALRAWIPVEASRGCWWGAKMHCTFCGLNGKTMVFRAKSARRVLEETDELCARHGPEPLQFADNILGFEHLAEVMPEWAARGDRRYKFFEIKSNLKREQILALRAAGVASVQPGIESFSDRTLGLMRKGVSGAQNAAMIRWCAEVGIECLWNGLYGFPGEDTSEMPWMAGLFREMVHLPPPTACAVIRMDRFSPNFERAAELGFSRVEPMPAYRHVLPFPEEAIRRAAYYFRYEHPGFEDSVEKGREIMHAQWEWAALHQGGKQGELRVVKGEKGRHDLIDTRAHVARGSRKLTRAEAEAVLACDAPVSRAQAISRTAASAGVSAEAAERALSTMLRRAVVVEIGTRLVSLAMLPADRASAVAVERSAKVSLNVLGG